jgi:hypothetical protein
MKPRFVIIVLLALSLAVPALMVAQGSKAEQEVRAVLAQSEQANLKGGAEAAATFEKILADDLTRIPPSGIALTKADIVNGFRTGKIKVESLENSDIKIRIYRRTAIATGVSTRKETFLGAGVTGSSRWTRVLVKRGGAWQIVLSQNTNIANSAKQ